MNAGKVTFTVLNGASTVGTPTTSGTVANGAAIISYALPAGTPAGTYTIQAVYSDAGGSLGSSSGSASLIVGPATPIITWSTPASITYGTALSSTQLKATASISGTFSYSPAAGTVLPAGRQTLNVTFTPSDATDYTTATKSVSLTVNLATPKFSPGAGSYTSAQTVTMTDSPGAAIYYTTDGTTPTTGSTPYQNSVSVSESVTIKAIAVESGLTNSTVGTAAYALKVPTPVIGPPGSGTYS
ncbi:MAG: chitobiase/beta-hexosaminidase C-terminal domain-containing protein, partial [Terracidiphilus sp.]